MHEPYSEFEKRLFNERVKKLLDDNGVSLEQMCEFTWFSVTRYENCIKSSSVFDLNDIVDDIATFFKIHPDYLLGCSEQPHEYYITPGKAGINMAHALRGLRKGKYSPQDVALNIGIPLNEYNAIEQKGHEPTLEIAIKLADYFNVSLDYLVGRSDNPNR